MFLVSSSIWLCAIYWSQLSSGEWRCSWSSADRRCSNCIWVINNLIVYYGPTYIRDSTVIFIICILRFHPLPDVVTIWYSLLTMATDFHTNAQLGPIEFPIKGKLYLQNLMLKLLPAIHHFLIWFYLYFHAQYWSHYTDSYDYMLRFLSAPDCYQLEVEWVSDLAEMNHLHCLFMVSFTMKCHHNTVQLLHDIIYSIFIARKGADICIFYCEWFGEKGQIIMKLDSRK